MREVGAFELDLGETEELAVACVTALADLVEEHGTSVVGIMMAVCAGQEAHNRGVNQAIASLGKVERGLRRACQ